MELPWEGNFGGRGIEERTIDTIFSGVVDLNDFS